jgi:hypothetical protein
VAAWQCDFVLVPVTALPRRSADVMVGEVTVADWDIDWWAASQPPADFETLIARLLRDEPSWSSDLRTWGTRDGTRVDVWREGGRVECILVRVDVRELEPDALRHLVALAVHCHAAFLRYDGVLVAADETALASAIATSAAARFVADPHAQLRRIALGGFEDA